MDTNIRAIEAVQVTSEESHFWQSFKSSVDGVRVPDQLSGYEKGGEFHIAHGMTVIRTTVVGAAGTLVEAWKPADVDDRAYLEDAGFTLNRKLNIPTIEDKRYIPSGRRLG